VGENSFPSLVSLACHDLRTPLATVHGFAKTLVRAEPLTERTARHLGMIEEASAQMGDLLDQVALVARIEAGRWKPELEESDSLELAQAAARRVDSGRVEVAGPGGRVSVPVDVTERALAAFADCALRHGGLDRVGLEVQGAELTFSPTTPESAPVLTGVELRDLGSAAGRRLVEALGGSVALEGKAFVVRLPA
jgi:signal transduction histidine kinase